MSELSGKLKELRIEEFIWIVYVGIIIFSFYSNSLERRYFLYGDNLAKEKYRSSLIIIFSILVLVYLYFFKDSLVDVLHIKPYDSYEKKRLVYLSFIGSLLILISGFVFLYIAYKDESLDVEIAFN